MKEFNLTDILYPKNNDQKDFRNILIIGVVAIVACFGYAQLKCKHYDNPIEVKIELIDKKK